MSIGIKLGAFTADTTWRECQSNAGIDPTPSPSPHARRGINRSPSPWATANLYRRPICEIIGTHDEKEDGYGEEDPFGGS